MVVMQGRVRLGIGIAGIVIIVLLCLRFKWVPAALWRSIRVSHFLSQVDGLPEAKTREFSRRCNEFLQSYGNSSNNVVLGGDDALVQELELVGEIPVHVFVWPNRLISASYIERSKGGAMVQWETGESGGVLSAGRGDGPLSLVGTTNKTERGHVSSGR